MYLRAQGLCLVLKGLRDCQTWQLVTARSLKEPKVLGRFSRVPVISLASFERSLAFFCALTNGVLLRSFIKIF